MNPALLTAVLAIMAAPADADPALGVTSFVVSKGEGRPLAVSAWYAGEGGTFETVAGNAVFEGVVAGRDAVPPEGKHPTVLLSHGGLRSANGSGAWLAAALARAGYLVFDLAAPRATRAADAVDEIWHRPADVSRVLDDVLATPSWAERIDPENISVVGYALRGTAALALAGGAFDPSAFADACEARAQGPDCAWYAAQGVPLSRVEPERLAQTRRDPRLRASVAISPEYLEVFTTTLANLSVPSLQLSFGPAIAPEIAAQPGGLSQAHLPDIGLFDAFPICTAVGPTILAEDGGDAALCGLSADARGRAHAAIAARVLRFLRADD